MKAMIDNYEQISSLMSFNISGDEFYHLQILKRKKEHPELGSNSYCVKTYFVSSFELFEMYYPEIKCLCDFHNARAYINLTKRSFKDLAFHTMKKVADQIMNKDYRSVRKAYTSVCGAHSARVPKLWVVDIDKNDDYLARDFCGVIEALQPNDQKKVKAIIPTKNGFHIITRPFNVQDFDLRMREWKELSIISQEDVPDIQKNNPTILYMPN